MLNHIKADIYRITKKKSLYLMMAIFTLGFSVIAFNFRSMPQEFPEFVLLMAQMSPILIGVFIFGAVYSDDLKSHTVQTAIGFGRKRTEIVITKIIEAALLLLFFYIYVFAHIILMNLIFSFNLSADSFKVMGYGAITYFLGTLVYFSIAGIINFSLQNSTFSTVSFVLLGTGFFESIFNLILNLNFMDSLLGWIRPYLLERVIGDLFSALNGIGSLTTPLLVLSVYLIGALVISSIVFNKVELEF